MAENSKIEWTDHTFNPWIGCTKVGPGCDHCYAERREDQRLHRVKWGPGQQRQRTKTWGEPVRWNKQHAEFFAAHGRRQRVFCASLADVFDNEVPAQWRLDLFRLIAATPNLDWLVLTKRIGNAWPMMQEVARMCGGGERPMDNVWLGATVVNQAEADRDIPKLLAVPARVRFLSIEPMLGPIDLTGHLWGKAKPCADCPRDADCHCGYNPRAQLEQMDGEPALHWVICGGESGPGARPMHPDWARSLRDQCAAAWVPFLFKQWGEWADERHVHLDQPIATRLRKTVSRLAIDGTVHPVRGPGPERYTGIYRVGNKAAGRLLDAVEHNGFPS